MAQTLTLNRVHDVRRDPQSGVRRLMSENHYISFRRDDGPTVFVQNGRAFHEGGPEFADDQLPHWFTEEAEKINAEARPKVGLDRLLARLNGPGNGYEPPVQPDSGGEADPTPPEPGYPATHPPETDAKGLYTDGAGNRMYWCAQCGVSVPSKKKGGHLMAVHKVGRR